MNTIEQPHSDGSRRNEKSRETVFDLSGSELWLDGGRREKLPIDSELRKIYELLNRSQVVVVQADTGAGKTTRIAQFGLLTNKDINIVMTQTRRNAVRWNGKRIAQEMGGRPGGLVGWRLFGEEPVTSKQTRLTLAIDQSLVNRIRQNGGELPPGLLVIDEAHERTISTDLLLGLIKEALANSPDTKVLITSATIDTKRFSEFFGEAPIVSVIGRCFPVDTEPIQLHRFEHHSEGAARGAQMILERFKHGKLVVPSSDGEGKRQVRKGAVLVLLPGKEDIRNVMLSIEDESERLKINDKVEVLSCHGESSADEQDKIQQPIKADTLRFVVGTEVLRSSVTVEGTIGVIDSLQIKRVTTNARGVGHLHKVSVSKAEAQQGRGRAGRTEPGFYMPVSLADEYDNLSAWPTPAILREPITSVVLQVASIGRSARNFAFIDPLPEEKLKVAFHRLQRLGALDEKEQITEVGKMLVGFPLDPERAKSLFVAEKLGVLPETIIAASIEESIFFQPDYRKTSCSVEENVARAILARVEKDRDGFWRIKNESMDPTTVDLTRLPQWMTHQGGSWVINAGNNTFPDTATLSWVGAVARLEWAKGSGNDFAAMVHAFRAYIAKERELSNTEPPKQLGGKKISSFEWRRRELTAWCERQFINEKRLRDAMHVMEEVTAEVKSSSLQLDGRIDEDRAFDSQMLTLALAAGLVDNVALNRGAGCYAGPLLANSGIFLIAKESSCDGGDRLILTGGIRTISSRRGVSYRVDIAAPIDYEKLKMVAPQLCKDIYLSDTTFNAERGGVYQTRVQSYGDLEVAREMVPAPQSPENTRIMAVWLSACSINAIAREDLKKIIQENRAQQERAVLITDRIISNEQTTLRIFSQAELIDFYVAALAGSQSLQAIIKPENFRLPAPDQSEVLAATPATVNFAGQQLTVRYDFRVANPLSSSSEYQKSKLSIILETEFESLEDAYNWWKRLPRDWQRSIQEMIPVMRTGESIIFDINCPTVLHLSATSIEEWYLREKFDAFSKKAGESAPVVNLDLTLPELPPLPVKPIQYATRANGGAVFAYPAYKLDKVHQGSKFVTVLAISYHQTAEDASSRLKFVADHFQEMRRVEQLKLDQVSLIAPAREKAQSIERIITEIESGNFEAYPLRSDEYSRVMISWDKAAGRFGYLERDPREALAVFSEIEETVQKAKEEYEKSTQELPVIRQRLATLEKRAVAQSEKIGTYQPYHYRYIVEQSLMAPGGYSDRSFPDVAAAKKSLDELEALVTEAEQDTPEQHALIEILRDDKNASFARVLRVRNGVVQKSVHPKDKTVEEENPISVVIGDSGRSLGIRGSKISFMTSGGKEGGASWDLEDGDYLFSRNGAIVLRVEEDSTMSGGWRAIKNVSPISERHEEQEMTIVDTQTSEAFGVNPFVEFLAQGGGAGGSTKREESVRPLKSVDRKPPAPSQPIERIPMTVALRREFQESLEDGLFILVAAKKKFEPKQQDAKSKLSIETRKIQPALDDINTLLRGLSEEEDAISTRSKAASLIQRAEKIASKIAYLAGATEEWVKAWKVRFAHYKDAFHTQVAGAGLKLDESLALPKLRTLALNENLNQKEVNDAIEMIALELSE